MWRRQRSRKTRPGPPHLVYAPSVTLARSHAALALPIAAALGLSAASCSSPTPTDSSARASSSPATSAPPRASSSSSPSAAPSAGATTAATPGFDDVPQLLVAGKDGTDSVLLSHRAELPASVTTLVHSNFVSPEGFEPGLSRASLAVGYLCGGAPLAAIALRAGQALYAVEAVESVLSDPHLRDWLACARRAAIASRWSYGNVVTAFGGAASGDKDARAGGARFFKAPAGEAANVAPPHFVAPTTAAPHLADVRCEHVDAGACLPGSVAVAQFPAWDVVGIGDYRTLASVGAGKAPFWKGADVAVEEADVRGLDFALSTPAAVSLGFLDFAVLAPSEEARDGLAAAIRAEGAMALEAIDSNHEGPGLLVLTAPTRAGAERLDVALTKLRAAIAKGALEPRLANATPDQIQWSVLRRMSLEASASAKQHVDGNAVHLESTLVVATEDREPADRAAATKAGLARVWAKLLDQALQGAAPAREDLAALGGDAFATAVLERHGRAPLALTPSAPLRAYPKISLPSNSPVATFETRTVEETSEGATVVVRYTSSSPHDVDQVTESLRTQGFTLSVASIGPREIGFTIHRGAELFSLVLRAVHAKLEVRVTPL